MTRSLEAGVWLAFIVGLGLSISLTEVSLLTLIAFWLIGLREPRARVALEFPLAGPFLAFIAATLLADFFSADVTGSLLVSRGTYHVAIFFLLVNRLRGADGAEWFLGRLFLVLTAVSVVGLVQVSPLCSPEPSWTLALLNRLQKCSRARGFYSIYMTLAGVLTLVLVAFLPRLLVRDRPRPGWELPAWFVMLGALVATYTRGAWLGFVAGMAALVTLWRGRRVASVVAGAISVLVLLVLGSLTISAPLRGGNLTDPATARERLYMWQAGVEMWRLNPLTGIGVGQVKKLFPSYALPHATKRSTSHLHNSPLQILVERGLLGLGAWLWIWTAFFRRGLGVLRRAGPGQERERALVVGALAAIAGFLVGGLSEYNFGDAEVVMIAYAVMAVPFLVESSLPRDAGEAKART